LVARLYRGALYADNATPSTRSLRAARAVRRIKIMFRELVWPCLATVAALIVYFVLSINVGRARVKYKVPAPLISGDPNFERALRVQQNTVEQMVSFVPALWLFSLLVSPVWGAALGGLWCVGRIVYAWGYYQAAEKRGPGFGIGMLASLSLLIGSLVGVVMALMKGA